MKHGLLLLLFLPGIVNGMLELENGLKQLKSKLSTLDRQMHAFYTAPIATKPAKPPMPIISEPIIAKKPEPQSISAPLKRLTSIQYNDLKKVIEEESKEDGCWNYNLNTYPVIQELEKELGLSQFIFSCLGKYIMISSRTMMRGNRELFSIDEVRTELNSYRFDKVTKEYKIHLMPKSGEDLLLIIERLLKEIQSNDQLQNSLVEIKFKTPDYQELKERLKKLKSGSKKVKPIIVIYPGSSKKDAQTVLNSVYKLFGTMEGLDMAPRFNEKITSLIYYAQSHGDIKRGNEFDEFFTEDKKFFKPDVEGKGYDIDYRLQNPAAH